VLPAAKVENFTDLGAFWGPKMLQTGILIFRPSNRAGVHGSNKLNAVDAGRSLLTKDAFRQEFGSSRASIRSNSEPEAILRLVTQLLGPGLSASARRAADRRPDQTE
jgi:hypothetical protein